MNAYGPITPVNKSRGTSRHSAYQSQLLARGQRCLSSQRQHSTTRTREKTHLSVFITPCMKPYACHPATMVAFRRATSRTRSAPPRATRRQRSFSTLCATHSPRMRKSLPVRLLLAAAEEEHVRRPVERLEVPDPQERRRHARQHTRCLRCLALNSELWEGHQRERARGGDVESLHRCQHGLY